ncbi:MAG: 1-phosphofructokinase family hexose kinase [Propionibacteriaceae bacterium]|jgi:1-phosphofructokinase|nr:1-phosphofructokinase family hexose kinase [Propionibacteriaceae bacterium]
MIVTVTCNPALDKTVTLDELAVGELNRLGPAEADAGGKGINVSKTIAALGGQSVATGFVGGGVGRDLARQVAAWPGIAADFIEVAGQTRTNLKVIDHGSRLTELNEPGVWVTAAEAEALASQVEGYARDGATVVLAGSLCQGVDPSFYADLIRRIHAAGGQVALDADGEAFRRGLEAGPDLVKPNRHELWELATAAGHPDIPPTADALSLADLAALATDLIEGGRAGRVAVSLGGDGALFVAEGRVLRAPALDVPVLSTVGAGDAMMAALVWGSVTGLSWPDTATLALACSAGAVTTRGTKPPQRDLVDALSAQVRLTELS